METFATVLLLITCILVSIAIGWNLYLYFHSSPRPAFYKVAIINLSLLVYLYVCIYLALDYLIGKRLFEAALRLLSE